MKVVVLGAGFAGLAAALRLRLAGADVTVLDALDRPGGKAALGEADFSSGPTVLTMPDVFRALSARAGLPAPTLEAALPTTRYAYPDGRTFAPGAVRVEGLDGTLAQLRQSEGAAYLRLLRASRTMFRDAARTFLFAPPPTPLALARYARTGGLNAAPHRTLAQFVTSGPHLTPFWLRFATYLGANPYRAPAVLHNIAWVELGHGVWHLRDPFEGQQGLLGFAARLQARAAALGVQFEWGARVEHLLTERGRVVAAHTRAGVFTADAWVSALDTAFTAQLLGRAAPRTARGVSGFALQLRLREDLGRAHHVLFPERYAQEWQDLQAGRLPADPTLYLHLDGERAFLLVNAPPRPEAVHDREEYARFLLARLAARLPLPVASWRALGPGEYARTGQGGALYGRAPHGLVGSLRPGWRHAGVLNLAQVGGTVHPGGGVPLSMLSGWNGAGTLLDLPYDDLGGEMLEVDDALLA
ncbi:phytoene desaturase family protein [Deinococcus maricopensis]|uniref:FAD dependent oxidoreductase n=1 Tax=Deinococcus maricopensis (strain DSM 21211 / LMG 22137 / NRRL B-23946 / LB-34) TaxID=709986 RepID=E8U4M7_DEIML|nr:NAD(P)/FAD-dependent oxidoreductase [Deinococcus maricopensis]ADV68892.1 FAD dependent oxidoreductase [Deinococcus maricopensis DSM 21211]